MSLAVANGFVAGVTLLKWSLFQGAGAREYDLVVNDWPNPISLVAVPYVALAVGTMSVAAFAVHMAAARFERSAKRVQTPTDPPYARGPEG